MLGLRGNALSVSLLDFYPLLWRDFSCYVSLFELFNGCVNVVKALLSFVKNSRGGLKLALFLFELLLQASIDRLQFFNFFPKGFAFFATILVSKLIEEGLVVSLQFGYLFLKPLLNDKCIFLTLITSLVLFLHHLHLLLSLHL